MSFYGWAPYVPVAERCAKALKQLEKVKKKGFRVQPVQLSGRKIADSFWGKGWCDHMESFSDYANRLPRGRSYGRNGSVCHLEINDGGIKAIVSGSAQVISKKHKITSAGALFPDPLTGDAIYAWRSFLGETQSLFAKRLRITASSVSQWETKGDQSIGMLPRTLLLLRDAWKKTHLS